MTIKPDAAYLSGLDFFGDVVARVPPGAWEQPSPCRGWTARDVVGHVGGAVRFGTGLLGGSVPEWRPADRPGIDVDGDPARWWEALVPPARAALEGVDLTAVVESPLGRRTIGEGLGFPAVDLFVHGWDLGRAAGLAVEIPAEAIDFARRMLAGFPDEQIRAPSVFGAEVDAPPGATASETFLAWTGRDPRG